MYIYLYDACIYYTYLPKHIEDRPRGRSGQFGEKTI